MQQTPRTIGEVATALSAPQWRIRRIVDRLQPDVPRAGQYRLVPADLIPRIAAELAEKTNRAERGRDG